MVATIGSSVPCYPSWSQCESVKDKAPENDAWLRSFTAGPLPEYVVCSFLTGGSYSAILARVSLSQGFSIAISCCWLRLSVFKSELKVWCFRFPLPGTSSPLRCTSQSAWSGLLPTAILYFLPSSQAPLWLSHTQYTLLLDWADDSVTEESILVTIVKAEECMRLH